MIITEPSKRQPLAAAPKLTVPAQPPKQQDAAAKPPDVPPSKPKNPHFVQTGFLQAARRSGSEMEFRLISGQLVVGRICECDQYCILLDSGGKSILVFKHAIETIEAKDALHAGTFCAEHCPECNPRPDTRPDKPPQSAAPGDELH